MAVYTVVDSAFSSVADAIRLKGGTSASLTFPEGFISAINDISGGGDDTAWIEKTLVSVSNSTARFVGQSAFAGCSTLTDVSLTSVSYIESSAFDMCTSLKNIYVPNVTAISGWAFAGCYSLESISFPLCVSAQENAFQQCSSLSEVYLPVLNSIGAFAFNSCSNLVDISLPLLSSCPFGLFYECASLKNVSLPEASVVGSSAFAGCNYLEEVTLCSSGTIVSENAFAYCYSLSRVNGKITACGEFAFSRCMCLKSIDISMASAIGSRAFYSCSQLANADINNASVVFPYAFYACHSLQHISVPSLLSISGSAFYTAGLREFDAPLCSQVSLNAFCLCSNLSRVRLMSVASIAASAFLSCYYLTSFVANFSTGGMTIGASAFSRCVRLESLYLIGTASTVATLSNSNAFLGTPMQSSTVLGRFGSIFVRESMVSQYKSANVWSTYSDRITGISDADIEALLSQW